jgi:hypothetical protein
MNGQSWPSVGMGSATFIEKIPTTRLAIKIGSGYSLINILVIQKEWHGWSWSKIARQFYWLP